MNSIEGYIIINKNCNQFIKFFIAISTLIIAIFLLLLNLKFKKYYYNYGQVIITDNKYYLLVNTNTYELDIIKNNNILYIDNTAYNYSIYLINDYTTVYDNASYKTILLDIDLSSKDKIENNTIKIKVLKSNKKLFYYIIDYIKKGG